MSNRPRIHLWVGLAFSTLALAFQAQAGDQVSAARPAPYAVTTRPPLFFKEEWADPKGSEHVLSQKDVTNASLELDVFGPGSRELRVSGSPTNEFNPPHVWTGMCTGPCGLTLRDKARFLDLTGLARIRWNIKVSGFHKVRPVIKLPDGKMFVGDPPENAPRRDFNSLEFNIADLQWIEIDPARGVTKGPMIDYPDMARVDAIGFIDLMPSSGHGEGGWSDLAQFEVFAKSADR